jgi:DNA-binding LacI/PurR family transcriptional regulator
MPTIFDVARAAGVGIGTVSRVLNDSPLVSDQTRQRVIDAMQRLRYRPSPAARAFGGRRTGTLELIVPLYTRSFFLETIRGCEEALADAAYTLAIRTVDTADDRARALDECCMRSDADGALLVWLAPTEDFVERISTTRFPVVLLNAVDPRLWSLAVDHEEAAANAVTYCLGLGHQRVGLVDRLGDPYDAGGDGICRAGYERALLDAGRPVVPDYHAIWEFNASGGAAAADALLDLEEPPTAILAGSDVQAVGIVERARALGWRVPEDLSVVGYNDNDLAAFLGLTTVQVPVRDMGRAATQLLLDVIGQPEAEPMTTYLPTQLVRRRTCAPPRAAA